MTPERALGERVTALLATQDHRETCGFRLYGPPALCLCAAKVPLADALDLIAALAAARQREEAAQGELMVCEMANQELRTENDRLTRAASESARTCQTMLVDKDEQIARLTQERYRNLLRATDAETERDALRERVAHLDARLVTETRDQQVEIEKLKATNDTWQRETNELRKYAHGLKTQVAALREALVRQMATHNMVNTRTRDLCACEACRMAQKALAGGA